MDALLIGYPRVSTDEQDLTALQEALGVHRVDLDQGLTGTNRDQPGLREALAACTGRAVARRKGPRNPVQAI